MLNDDAVPAANTPAELLRNVTNIANDFVRIHGGKTRFIYDTALKGFSLELPNEAAAIAISQDPRVKYVESNALGSTATVCQLNPPEGLDRIDQMNLPLDQKYCYNATGSGVTAYVLDTGIRSTHTDLGVPRAYIAADYITGVYSEPCNLGGGITSQNNDCAGHGTYVSAIVGGSIYGAAKAVNIGSVKVCRATDPDNLQGSCTEDVTASGVNWVTATHNANPSQTTLVNMSLDFPSGARTLRQAVIDSITAGVTYAVIAGLPNSTTGDDAGQRVPANVTQALTVGASNQENDTRSSLSNIGSVLDLFAPGFGIPSARNTTDSDTFTGSGTSPAAPHVAGAVALYLEGRTGAPGSACFDINSQVPDAIRNNPGSYFAKISTCPDRVNQVIDSNAGLLKLNASTIGSGSPNRLLWTAALPAPTDPIDNQRFFVWQHYGDFKPHDNPLPDETGLDYWTCNITGGCEVRYPSLVGHGCGTGLNDNNTCTGDWRINTSLAFWVDKHPELFTGSYGLTSGSNPTFVADCYSIYLERPYDAEGYAFWLGVLNSFGDPASAAGVHELIKDFIGSKEYRERFGQP